MWIVLPTKNCKCETCVKLRTEVIDEEGNTPGGLTIVRASDYFDPNAAQGPMTKTDVKRTL